MLKYYLYHIPELVRLEPILDTTLAQKEDNVNNADFVLTMVESRKQHEDKHIEFLNSTNKPIIIVERVDSCPLWFRYFDNLPNLVCIYKNRNFRDLKRNNDILFKGRQHYLMIHKALKLSLKYNCKEHDLSKEWKMQALKPISNENINKIRTILWDFHSSPIGKYSSEHQVNQSLLIEQRVNDVFCVNHERPGIQDLLRNRVKHIVRNLPEKYKTITQKMEKSDYDKLFRQSKVCIACPGWGEWVHMDGYAMMSRVVLLKPECDYIKMDPDIYQEGKYYVPFKYDLKDLNHKIKYYVDNYESQEVQDMLDRAETLIRSISVEETKNNFWKDVKSQLETSTN
jgi:hypothetical protein